MVFLIFIQTLIEHSLSKRFVASDLGLHCVPMSHKKDDIFIWVKRISTNLAQMHDCKGRKS